MLVHLLILQRGPKGPPRGAQRGPKGALGAKRAFSILCRKGVLSTKSGIRDPTRPAVSATRLPALQIADFGLPILAALGLLLGLAAPLALALA